jgi:hypothetical protein
MAGLRFTDMQSRPTEFLDLTSITLEEFQQLVPPFEAAFQAHMATWRLDGKPRTARQFTVYKNCPLPTPEDGFQIGDPVAYGQKTAVRPLTVYRRSGCNPLRDRTLSTSKCYVPSRWKCAAWGRRSSVGLRPSFCPTLRVLAGTQPSPGEPNVGEEVARLYGCTEFQAVP